MTAIHVLFKARIAGKRPVFATVNRGGLRSLPDCRSGNGRFFHHVAPAAFHALIPLALQRQDAIAERVGVGLQAARCALLLIALCQSFAGGAATRRQSRERQQNDEATQRAIHGWATK